MSAKFIKITSKQLGASFYVYKATKHHSVCNGTQTAVSAAQPGDYVAVDQFFNMLVFNRQQFKAAFGHKVLEQLDEV